MLSQNLRRIYEDWINKADSYRGDNLSNHFDRFTSLYIVYNAMYMHVMSELAIQGKQIAKKFRDKTAAVDYVIQYLGSRNYIEKLLDDEQSENCLNGIIELLQNERFYIVLDWGNRNRSEDLRLLSNLRSSNNQIKARAILTLFYHVRCNMFHGHKRFAPYQRELLEPMNFLLRKTITILYDRFTNMG